MFWAAWFAHNLNSFQGGQDANGGFWRGSTIVSCSSIVNNPLRHRAARPGALAARAGLPADPGVQVDGHALAHLRPHRRLGALRPVVLRPAAVPVAVVRRRRAAQAEGLPRRRVDHAVGPAAGRAGRRADLGRARRPGREDRARGGAGLARDDRAAPPLRAAAPRRPRRPAAQDAARRGLPGADARHVVAGADPRGRDDPRVARPRAGRARRDPLDVRPPDARRDADVVPRLVRRDSKAAATTCPKGSATPPPPCATPATSCRSCAVRTARYGRSCATRAGRSTRSAPARRASARSSGRAASCSATTAAGEQDLARDDARAAAVPRRAAVRVAGDAARGGAADPAAPRPAPGRPAAAVRARRDAGVRARAARDRRAAGSRDRRRARRSRRGVGDRGDGRPARRPGSIRSAASSCRWSTCCTPTAARRRRSPRRRPRPRPRSATRRPASRSTTCARPPCSRPSRSPISRHREPHNRGNAYLAPGGIEKIRNGPLEAFDCRNTKNAVGRRGLGSSPPCVQQQPWEFQGPARTVPAARARAVSPLSR